MGDTGEEQQSQKPRKPGAFSKNDPRINRAGRPRAGQAADEEGVSRPSRLLRDMRMVYAQPERKDRTEGQWTLRKLLRESPKEFIQQLARLEAAQTRRRGSGAGKGTEESEDLDDGTARCLELLEQEWNQEWKRMKFLMEVCEPSLGGAASRAAANGRRSRKKPGPEDWPSPTSRVGVLPPRGWSESAHSRGPGMPRSVVRSHES
jgi:hypothetical protein